MFSPSSRSDVGLSPFKKAASKLAFRIYFFSLVQFVMVNAGMFLILTQSGPPPMPFTNTVNFIAATISETGGDRAAVAGVVARLRSSLRCSVAIYDQDDRLISHDPLMPAPDTRAQLVPPAPALVVPVPMPGGKTWSLVFLAAPPISKPPVFWSWLALIVVGVAAFSLLIARTLVRPLARLATAAHEFGSGKLDARVQLERSDELGQVGTAFDRMADRVTHALRVEKELLANVSHELRTPLQRIHIAIELAAEGDATTARESLNDIAEDLGELERIVEDVLTATRLSLSEGAIYSAGTASPPIRRAPVDLRTLLEKSATRFRLAHATRRLRVNIADDLPPLAADSVLIRRVVDNLLDNANKYTDDATADIGLVAGSAPGKAFIEVRDHGVGIAGEDLARVFEPFFRADRSRTRTTGGLGLGLTLARRIVEGHGGTLTIESAVGAGTTARVELPIEPM